MDWRLIARFSIYGVEFPWGIRNSSGFVVIFPHIIHFEGQTERYVQKCKEMMELKKY